jgi:ATP-dependent protease ClpP protease subunit
MVNTILFKRSKDHDNNLIEETHDYGLILETREIFIYGESDDDDIKMAMKLIKNIRILDQISHEPIVIHQYNPGGTWESGMAIYDAIKTCESHVIFIMHGIACSMGGIIPQAADTRVMMPNCTFMIHQGSVSYDGTFKQYVSYSDFAKGLQERTLQIFCEVCAEGPFFQQNNYTTQRIKTFLNQKMNQKEEWWLDAESAIYYGFADFIFGDDHEKCITLESLKETLYV